MAKTRTKQFTKANVAQALALIEAWVRGVRRAVSRMDPAATTTLNWAGKSKLAELDIPGFILEGCGPKPPAKRPTEPKAKKKKR